MAGKSTFSIFQSHPIQYFSPLYKEMSNAGIDVSVNYYTSHGLNNELDVEFNANVKWDLPLLEGYESNFLKNNAVRPSVYGFFGCINWSVFREVKSMKDSYVLVYGWKYFTDILVMTAAILYGKKLCLRTETPWSQESLNASLKARFKRTVLRRFIFPFVHKFFYIGTENKRFYENLGINEDRLVFVPYSVDNHRFASAYEKLKDQKKELLKSLGIERGSIVFLFSGKLIPKKRPLDLLHALKVLNRDDISVVFLGDGELREEMEDYIVANSLQNVTITGFINQSEIGKYYTIADAFVMCSEVGETWGLSANEAMNFHLPVLLSRLTGSSIDLVDEGNANGYIFNTKSFKDLSLYMEKLIEVSLDKRKEMGDKSAEIIKKYSYNTIVENLLALR